MRFDPCSLSEANLPGVHQLAELVLRSPEQRLNLSPILDVGEAIAGLDDPQHLLDPGDEVFGVLPARDSLPGNLYVDRTRVSPDGPVEDERRFGAADAQGDPATPSDRQLHVQASDPQPRRIARRLHRVPPPCHSR